MAPNPSRGLQVETRTTGAAWPLVGRKEELEHLRQLRSGSRPRSALLSGAAGVGKSRVAREALDQAAREGWSTLVVRGSAGFTGVPLGPFRTVLHMPPATELAELIESAARELVAMRSAKGLLLFVDDSQALDEASSALLHQMVTAGLISAIVTSRSGTHPPAAVTDLWKDGFAERIELQSLSQRETTELLAAGLGGAVQESSANRIWRITTGNPLYLREVILSGSETGALRLVDGEWRWHGAWATGARLQEIVAARLGRLDPDELTAMELLALAGSLPLDLVTFLTTARAVDELGRRGLVTTERSHRRVEVAVGHPLHAEVLRGEMHPLHRRSMWRNLVDALAATGARRAADRVRLACWSLESGLDVDPMTLVLGADATLNRTGRAISARLREIVPDATAEVGDGLPVTQDPGLAKRLARAAYEQRGGLTEGFTLASVLAWSGDAGSAEAVLAELAGKAVAIDDRLRVALGRAWIAFWARYEVDVATALLTDAVAEGENGGDGLLMARVHQDLAGIALNTARPALALAHSERSAAAQKVPLSQSVAAGPAAAALGHLGRHAEALALVDEALPASHESGQLLAVAQLLLARAGALSLSGEIEQARQLVEWLREVALAEGLPEATATFGVVLGQLYIQLGRPASAGRVLRDSAGLLAEKDILGYRPWALSGLARARALSGEEESAAAALEEARRSQPIARFFDMSHYLAEIEIHLLAGRTAEAERAARAGAAWAREAEMTAYEAQCLESWLRVEPSEAIAGRLAELAAATDSRLVGALAVYARALVDEDPVSLLAVSERFAEMSAWNLAAYAAAAAAEIHDRRHDVRAAKAASRLAANFADHCEGDAASAARVPAGGPVRLTRREREIARLAAGGRSTREIAETLFLSARTVENHLHRAYVKLGVTDRSTLAAELAHRPV
jgi:DNA-binding CsgD family transcriptional regulator